MSQSRIIPSIVPADPAGNGEDTKGIPPVLDIQDARHDDLMDAVSGYF